MFVKFKENGLIEYLTNYRILDEEVEVADSCVYPILIRGEVFEAGDEMTAKYLLNLISKEEYRQYLLNKLKEDYKKKFAETDNTVMMYLKKVALQILEGGDAETYNKALEDYRDIVLEYREKRDKILKDELFKDKLLKTGD